MPPKSPKSPPVSVAESLARTVRGWELHPLLTDAVQDIGISPTTLLSRVLSKTSRDLADCLVDSRCATGRTDVVGTAEAIWQATAKSSKGGGGSSSGSSGKKQSETNRGSGDTAASGGGGTPLYNTAAALQERQSLLAVYACQCLLTVNARPPALFRATAAAAAAAAATMTSAAGPSSSAAGGRAESVGTSANSAAPPAALPPGYRSPNVALIIAQSEAHADHICDLAMDLAECCHLDVQLSNAGDLFTCFDVKHTLQDVEKARGWENKSGAHAGAATATTATDGDTAVVGAGGVASEKPEEGQAESKDHAAAGRRGTIIVTTLAEYVEWSRNHQLADVKVLLPPPPPPPQDRERKEEDAGHDSLPSSAAGTRVSPEKEKPSSSSSSRSNSSKAGEDEDEGKEGGKESGSPESQSLASANNPTSPVTGSNTHTHTHTSSSSNHAVGSGVVSSADATAEKPFNHPWIGLHIVSVVVEDIALVQASHEVAWVGIVRSFEAANARFRKHYQQLQLQYGKALDAHMYGGGGGNSHRSGSGGANTQSFVDFERTPHHLWMCLAPLACISPMLRALLDRKNRRYYPLLTSEPRLGTGTNGGRVAPAVARSLSSTYPLESVFLRLILQLDERDAMEQVRTLLEQKQYFRKVSLLTHTKELGPLQSTILGWRTYTSLDGGNSNNHNSGNASDAGGVGGQRSTVVAMRHDTADQLSDKVMQWLYGTNNPTAIAGAVAAAATAAAASSSSSATTPTAAAGGGRKGGAKKDADGPQSNSSTSASHADPLRCPSALIAFDGSPLVDLMDTDCLILMYPPQKSLLVEEWASFIQSLHTTANGELDIEAALWRNGSNSQQDVARLMQQLHRGLSVSPEMAARASSLRRPCVVVMLLNSKDFSLITHFLDQYYYSGATGVVTPQAAAMSHSAVQPNRHSNGNNNTSANSGGQQYAHVTLSGERANPPILNVAATHPLFVPLISCEAECAWGRQASATAPATPLVVSYSPLEKESERRRVAAVMDHPATLANVLRAKFEKEMDAPGRSPMAANAPAPSGSNKSASNSNSKGKQQQQQQQQQQGKVSGGNKSATAPASTGGKAARAKDTLIPAPASVAAAAAATNNKADSGSASSKAKSGGNAKGATNRRSPATQSQQQQPQQTQQASITSPSSPTSADRGSKGPGIPIPAPASANRATPPTAAAPAAVAPSSTADTTSGSGSGGGGGGSFPASVAVPPSSSPGAAAAATPSSTAAATSSPTAAAPATTGVRRSGTAATVTGLMQRLGLSTEGGSPSSATATTAAKAAASATPPSATTPSATTGSAGSKAADGEKRKEDVKPSAGA